MAKIEVKINGVETLVDVNKLEKTEDGLFAEYYNEDGTIDTITESQIKQEQEEQALKLEQSEARDEAMLTGATYTLNDTVYQISFTKEDGDGLVQVKSAFEWGLTQTTIHFSNGTKLPISSTDFPSFALWFVNKRNEFFL